MMLNWIYYSKDGIDYRQYKYNTIVYLQKNSLKISLDVW